MTIAIAATVHDPEFLLQRMVRLHKNTLLALFPRVAIRVTPESGEDVLRGLEFASVKFSRGDHGDTYSSAIHDAFALGADHVLYCDFDRLLHWVAKGRDELREILQKLDGYDFALIGRTEQALRTHPETQQMTERVVNDLGSAALGRKVDLISAAWWLSRDVLKAISAEDGIGLYTAWPMRAFHFDQRNAYIEAEGLEWETPDRYEADIATMGYQRWMDTFQTVRQWRYRVHLMDACLRTITPYLTARPVNIDVLKI